MQGDCFKNVEKKLTVVCEMNKLERVAELAPSMREFWPSILYIKCDKKSHPLHGLGTKFYQSGLYK